MERLKQTFLAPRTWVLFDQAVFSGGNFCLTIAWARLLGKGDFGSYASLVLVVYFAIGLLNALVIQPLQVSLPGIGDRKNYLSFAFGSQLGLTLLVSVGIGMGLQFSAAIPGMGSGITIGFFVFVFCLHDFLRKTFLATAQLKLALALDATLVLGQFGVLGYALTTIGIGIEASLGLINLGYLPALVLGVWVLRPSRFPNRDWKGYAMIHLQQGKWLVTSSLVQWWSGNLFVVASGLYLGREALGAFRLIQSLFGVLSMLFQTMENYAVPRTAQLLKESPGLAKAFLARLRWQSAILVGGLLALVGAFPRLILEWVAGAEYLEYAFVVQGMAFLYLIILLGYPIRLAIRALVLNQYFFTGNLLALSFGLLSFQYLLEQHQLMGAVAGLIGAQIVVLLFWQYILYRKNFYSWKSST